jgi:hypothetical protein
MGSFFGGKKTKTTQTNEPWSVAQPYLKDVYGQAQGLYQGGAPQFWGGTAMAGLTPEMQTALSSIWSRAQAGNPQLAGAQSAVGDIASGGAMGTNPAFDFLSGLVNSPNANPAMGYASDLASNMGDNPALQYLTAEASGQNLGNNPYLDAIYQQGANQLTDTFRKTQVPALQSDYALTGRYGSNAMKTALEDQQQKVTDAASGLATQIYGGAYEADRARQATAAQALSGAYGQDVTAKLGAGQFLSGVYDTDLQRKLYGAQTLGNLGQSDVSNLLSAAGMVPGLGAADYQDLDRMLATGQYGQDRSQAEQDLARQRFDYGQQSPYDWLAKYAQLVYGSPGSSGYGTQTGTQKSSGGGFWDILQAGAAGAGTAIRNSDVRVKTEIQRVGTLDNGLPVYAYRYVWGGPMEIGVMAQDVEKLHPDAVSERHGVKMVDYRRAVT